MRRNFPVELREAQSGPGRLSGVVLPFGRVAGDRREVFAPGSVSYPHNGIRLLLEHRGRQFARVTPEMVGNEMRISLDLPDTTEGREAARMVQSGERAALSIEFHALQQAIVSGVREIRSAIVDAAALVPSGAYDQARVELRGRRRRVWL